MTQERWNHTRRFLLTNGDLFLFCLALFLKEILFCLQTTVPFTESSAAFLVLILLVVLSLACLLPRGLRFGALLTVNLLLSLLFLADLLYWRFFHDVISIPILLEAWQALEVGSSIFSLLRWTDLGFVADLPLWVVLWRARRRVPALPPLRWNWRGKCMAAVSCIVVFWGSLESAKILDAEWFTNIWCTNYLAYRLGITGFHVYDFFHTLHGWANAPEVREEDIQRVQQWFEQRRVEDRKAPVDPTVPFGIARGKNVIYLQMESFMPDLIGLKHEGQEVTPNLNQFLRESLHFPFCFDQTGTGRSSDGDYTAHNSLHPVARGSFVFRYPQNQLESLPQLLRAYGYYTYISCGMNGGFWNMAWMHRRYGFDECVYLQDLTEEEGEVTRQGILGISDASFFRQHLERIEKLPRPFLAHFLTLTTHYPYNGVPEKDQKLRLGKLEGTLAGDLLQSVHYTDYALGLFFKGLKERHLYDDSLIILYGDHVCWIPREDNVRLQQPGLRPWNFRALDRVALMMRLPGSKAVGQRQTVTGHLDIAPSVLHLLGISREGTFFMGHNVFRDNGNAVVVFRNGSFADQKYLFLTPNGTFESGTAYLLAQGEVVTPAPCQKSFQEARLRLWISDRVIEGDLLGTLKERASRTGMTR
jgi:phosphoglycerol transferase MdoB-like AlkP superfamily enzyme